MQIDHDRTQKDSETTSDFKFSEQDDRRRATEDKRAAPGASCQGFPGPQDDDCKPHYHEQRHSCYGERAPSAGWRAVYDAMGVDER